MTYENFKTYYRSLSKKQREAYAKRAKTSTGYIELLLTKNRTPRKQTMERLAKASRGACSYEVIVDYFFDIAA